MAATNKFQTLESLDASQQALEDQLTASPTAYTDNTDPSKRDLMTQVRLKEVQAARDKLASQKIKEQWYGPAKPEDTVNAGTSSGLLEKGLNLLSTPLYGVAGAAKYALGKGTGNLVNSVVANATKEKETFGDILQKEGTPHWLSAPMGFMLDVAFDPVNWVSFGGGAALKVGTQALIPRIATGLLKGGVEGASLGMLSRGAELANTAGRLIPGLKKTGAMAKIGEKAVQYGEDYNKAIGFDVMKQLEQDANRVTMGDRLHTAIASMPSGETLLKTFQYFPAKWQQASELADEWMTAQKQAGKNIPTQGWYNGAIQAPTISEAGLMAKGTDITAMREPLPANTNGFVKTMTSLNDDVEKLAYNPKIARALDGEEAAYRMAGEAENDINKNKLLSDKGVMDDFLASEGETGIKWYDNMMKSARGLKINDVPYAKKILDTLDVLNSHFKLAKTSLNPSTYTNAIMGNPVMAMMYGINIANKKYAGAVKEAFDFTRGKNIEEFTAKFGKDTAWNDYASKYPETFRKVYGMRPEEVGYRQSLSDFLNSSEAAAERAKFGDNSEIIKTKLEQLAEEAKQAGYGPASTGQDFMKPGTRPEDAPTSFGANELYSNAMYDYKKWLGSKAEGGNTLAKAYLAYLEKPAKWYQKIDDSYKLGTAIHLTSNGVTESELLKMSKQLKLQPGDVTKHVADGETLYKLSPRKATEAANEIYMNYAAMPAMVKMMRSVPLLGSPFISFTYGMAHKVAKTAAYNPAMFNKVNFGMQEIGGQASPLEKKAMENKYYKWYSQPGMMRLPIVQDNPVYMNMVNWLPYYSMNLFTPSEKKYADTIPGTLTKMLDHSPIMQSPIGQTIFNYVLQPMLIQGEVPQGQFGQPLYPIGASTLSKMGYASRDLVDSVVPGVAGLAGLANVGLDIPASALEYVPSFRFRDLANAVKGRNIHGDTSSKSGPERTLTSGLGALGVPVKPMDLNYLSTQVKKGLIQ